MKMKEHYEDFVSKNLKEFYGIRYCNQCKEVLQDEKDTCCQVGSFLFEEADKGTQRAIVLEELSKYA